MRSYLGTRLIGDPATNTLFAAFFLALDRLQQTDIPPDVAASDIAEERGSITTAMVDPAAIECVLRSWTLRDSQTLGTMDPRIL